MDRKFLIILAVAVVGLVGIFVYSSNKNSKNSDANTSSSTASVSNHSKGANTKNVELLAYGDFQCPACAQFYPIEKQVVDKYINDIKFTFRHYPLDSIHPNARAAHRAAEAAGLQGKFFEMHDLLYEKNQEWVNLTSPQTTFEQYAVSLSLNLDKFKTDYASESVNATINADKKEGNSKQITGTPTYFINGKKIDNGDISSVEAFSKQIDEAIKASSGQ